MFFPYKIAVPITKWSIVNIMIVFITLLFFILFALGTINQSVINSMVLTDFSLSGIFGCLLLHAGLSHLFFSGVPAIGASGAVNGIIGLSLVFFPISYLAIRYIFWFPFIGFFRTGVIQIKAYWMILVGFIIDIIGILSKGGHVAYMAHIGGFLSGIILGFFILIVFRPDTYETTLVDILNGDT